VIWRNRKIIVIPTKKKIIKKATKQNNGIHRERDSMGRFIARGRRSIFTTPTTPPRVRQDTPPSQTHTPSLRIPGIQEATQLEDSPTSSTKPNLGEEPFFTSIGEPIVVEEVGIPREEEVETLSH